MLRSLPLLVALLATPALAQDYAAEAKARMGLSFDLDAVEALVASPAQSPHVPIYTDKPLPLEPNSAIERVTVYRSQAVVTRVREAALEAGLQVVTFEGLPAGLDASSLHASVVRGDVRIVGVELESGLGEVEETERIEALRDEMEGLTEELGGIRDEMEALLARRAYLRSALVGGREAAPPALDDAKATLEWLGEAEADIARSLRELEKEAKELDEDLRPLLIKLDNPHATGQVVQIEVDAAAGAAELALQYGVQGANWLPSYSARLDPATSTVELEYSGVVRQTTREVWDDAELFLSTASPDSAGTLPELGPWYLGRTGAVSIDPGWHDETPIAARMAPTGGVIDSRMSAGVRGGGTVVFAIDGRRTVTGDGSAQRLPIGAQTFEADIELATVPKLVPEVFRTATIRYDGEIPMIPGPIATHVGGEYVGSSWTHAVVPGEPLKLSFGTDDRLKVSRRLVSREQDHVGLGRKTVRYTLDFRIGITNYTDTEQQVALLDQLPIAEADRVEVKALEVTDGAAEDADHGPGVLKWMLAVPPGDDVEVQVRFQVTAPAGVRWASASPDDPMHLSRDAPIDFGESIEMEMMMLH